MSTKVSALPAITTLANTDLLYAVSNASVTPTSDRMALGDFKNNFCTGYAYADVFSGADIGAKANAAIAALPAAGGTVIFPGGSSSGAPLAFSTPIVSGTYGKVIHFRGPGAASCFLYYTPTSGNAFTINDGNPTGHLVGETTGFTLMGSATLLAAGATNTNTSVGIFYGGSNGAVGKNTHDLNVNGFGTNWEIGSNAYMLAFNNCSNSGGNGGQASRGALVHINTASNSGERNVFNQVNFTDPGNSNANNAIYITSSGTASNTFSMCSIDNAQLFIGTSNGQTTLMGCHIENPGTTIYPEYIPILGVSSDSSTQISVIGCEWANSASGRTWTTCIRHGGQLYAAGNHINNYNSATITNFILHDLDNGAATDYCVQLQVQTGTLTNIIGGSGGVPYSVAAGNTAIYNVKNSYSIGLRANQSNTNNFFSGSVDTGSYDHSGNWGFIGTVTVGSKILAAASTTSNATLNIPAGTAPTSPNDGDMWREDNTNTGLKIRVNGVTKTITLA